MEKFNDFYCHDSGLKEFELENSEKLNVLVIHASLDGGWDDERIYNPISSKLLIQFCKALPTATVMYESSVVVQYLLKN